MGLAAAALTASCGGPAPASTVSVRDSAGVRIVENVGTPGRRAPFGVSPEPVFRIGWEGEGPLLESVQGGLVLDDGRVAVADGGRTKLIHILSPSGRVLTSFGGEGEGPGEFGGITGVASAGGDTILVGDARNGRVSLFAGGTLVRDERFVPWVGRGAYAPIGRVDDGYALWLTAYLGAANEVEGWDRFAVPRLGNDLVTLDTVAVVDFTDYGASRGMNPIRPYGVVTVAGAEVVHGRSDRAELVWRRGDGVVRQIARWDAEPGDPTEEDWERYAEEYRERNVGRSEPEEIERVLGDRRGDLEGPLLPFRRAYGARDGSVWLSPYRLAGSTDRSALFEVVARDGEYLGEITLPRPLRPLDVTERAVLGVEYDEFDVQAVVMYRIERAN